MTSNTIRERLRIAAAYKSFEKYFALLYGWVSLPVRNTPIRILIGWVAVRKYILFDGLARNTGQYFTSCGRIFLSPVGARKNASNDLKVSGFMTKPESLDSEFMFCV